LDFYFAFTLAAHQPFSPLRQHIFKVEKRGNGKTVKRSDETIFFTPSPFPSLSPSLSLSLSF